MRAQANHRDAWRRWRRQFDECVLLPALGAALPWPLAWRTLRALAHRGRFFGDETVVAAAMASSLGFGGDAEAWVLRHRLTRIVDQVDPALSATRGNRWMDHYLIVGGDPVPPGPCIFVGFHYGTGFWSLRHLRRHGHRVSFVSAPIDAGQWRSEPLRLAFMRWRQHRVEEAGGAPVIYVGGSRDRIRSALDRGVSILALIDVPEPTTSTVPVEFLGREVLFPDGLLEIGAAGNVPLIGYLARLEPDTGARHLRFTRLPADPAAALRALVALLEAAVRSDPAGWHFWGQWPRFLHGRTSA